MSIIYKEVYCAICLPLEGVCQLAGLLANIFAPRILSYNHENMQLAFSTHERLITVETKDGRNREIKAIRNHCKPL
jgi:hypothetical protein